MTTSSSKLSERDDIALWNKEVIVALNEYEPPYCECVNTGKRSLSWAPWVPGVSSLNSSPLDKENLELSHEHLIWEQSGANVGFGPDGLFGEDFEYKRYRMGSTCYDGSKMRKALYSVDVSQSYNFLRNNCQDFISRALAAYHSLKP